MPGLSAKGLFWAWDHGMLPVVSLVGPDRGPVLWQPVRSSSPFAQSPGIKNVIVIQYPLWINEPYTIFDTRRLPPKTRCRASLEEGRKLGDTRQVARTNHIFAGATGGSANSAMDFPEQSTIRWADPNGV